MVDIDRVKEKLQKIKAMTTSSNPEEVQTAMLTMKKFLDKHGLTEADIPLINENTIGITKERFTKKGNSGINRGRLVKFKDWEKLMASSIARLYDCEAIFGNYSMEFIGFPPDNLVAKEIYVWVRDSLYKIAKEYGVEIKKIEKNIRATSFIQDFMKGASNKIKNKCAQIIYERKYVEQGEHNKENGSLVVIKEEAIKEATKDLNRVDLELNYNSYVAMEIGSEEADKINLQKQIEEEKIGN